MSIYIRRCPSSKPFVRPLLQRAVFSVTVALLLATFVLPAWAGSAQFFPQLEKVFQPQSNWSVVIYHFGSGRIVYSQNPAHRRIPASNLKLLVTAAALEQLGPQFQYETSLLARGYLTADGVWQGDLLVKGAGDPTISGRFESDTSQITARLDRWAERLRSAGVRAISGRLIGDDSLFDRQWWGDGWPDNAHGHWYAAPAGALIFNDSCLDISIHPGSAAGRSPRLAVEPELPSLKIENSAVTVSPGGGATIGFHHTAEWNRLMVKGNLPLNTKPTVHCVAVKDPTMFFLETLRNVFKSKGIEVVSGVADQSSLGTFRKEDWRLVLTDRSPPLSEIVKVTNQRSQNLYADALLKTLGAHRSGVGTWHNGARVVLDELRGLGLNTQGIHMQDGSGLSRRNQVSAQQLADLLVRARPQKWFSVWYRSLAVSGDPDASLRKRFLSPALKGNVYAKTGYIRDVYALSGYLKTPQQEWYAFSFVFNGSENSGKHPHKRMEEALTFLAGNQAKPPQSAPRR